MWIFVKPEEYDPWEHVFALVVYGDKEVGVRCMEREEVRRSWGVHTFAWKDIDYPKYGIDDLGKVIDAYRLIPAEPECANAFDGL